ncbi:MAG: AraC family transcriptional regulator [Spirochaetes bacterium]|jgi:AraC-like DNA-binding protein|nr:AraC family transcriptional regulator [Spirochaetota bacterium]
MKLGKSILIPILLFPVFLFLLTIPDYRNNKKHIFPNSQFTLSGVTDAYDSGNSEIVRLETNNEMILLRYELKTGFAFPYVGIKLESNNKIPFEISDYDQLVINLDSISVHSIMINLITDISIYHEPNDSHQYITTYFSAMSNTEKGMHKNSISFSDFKIPEWWLTRNRIKKKRIREIQPESLYALEILVSTDTQLHKGEIEIASITVEKKRSLIIIKNFLKLSVAYLLFFGFIYFIRLRKTVTKAEKIILVHKNLELDNEKERLIMKLIDYLDKHFTDPKLTIDYVSKQTNISIYIIPALIKETSHLSFKQYINKLRIDQAKEMLSNSNTKIIDIAYSVGYNTVTHFNKIFKTVEGISPKEFRNSNH